MDEIIKLMIIEDDNKWINHAKQVFSGHPRIQIVYIASSGKEAMRTIEDVGVDAVLVSKNIVGSNGLEVARKINTDYPEIRIFLVIDEMDMQDWKKALGSGIVQIFDRPLEILEVGPEIEQAVDNIRKEYTRQRNRITSRPRDTKRSNGDSEVKFVKRSVVMVVSPKGGVGKTTLSVNMACAAAHLGRTKSSVAIVDFNKFGTVAIQLGLLDIDVDSDRSILSFEHLDEDSASLEEVTSFMYRHKSGLWVLPAVSSLDKFARIDEALVEKVINIMRIHFDFVVLDVPLLTESDVFVKGIKYVDAVICVVTPDVQVLSGMLQLRNELDEIGGQDKCVRVFNKHGMIGGLPLRKMNNYIPYPPIGVVAYDANVVSSINNHLPMVFSKPESEFVKNIIEVTSKVYPVFGEGEGNGLGNKIKGLLKKLS